MYPRYVDGGFVAFLQQDGTLFGAPYDARRRRLSGAPVPIADAVRFGPAFPAKLGVGRNGTVAYLGGRASLRDLVVTERDGRVVPTSPPERFYTEPRFSPDGQRIAMALADFAGPAATDVWIYDLRGGNLARLTFDSTSTNPEWTSDGRRLVYASRHGGRALPALHVIATDGSGTPESLLVRPNATLSESQLSRDGRYLVFRERVRPTVRDVWIAPLDSPQAARPLLRTPFDERGIALSPDGRWLAYVSNESGSDDVYVRAVEEGSGHWKVSRAGGREPRWGIGGRELLYRVEDSIMVVSFLPGAEPRFGPARFLMEGRFSRNGDVAAWDVSPDGRRFVFTRSRNESRRMALNVVLNWFDQLRAARR